MKNRYIVQQDNLHLRPGDLFEVGGVTWKALTYPYGATESYGGVTMNIGMVGDESNLEGDVLAEEVEGLEA